MLIARQASTSAAGVTVSRPSLTEHSGCRQVHISYSNMPTDKLGEVDNECTSHNFGLFAIFLAKNYQS